MAECGACAGGSGQHSALCRESCAHCVERTGGAEGTIWCAECLEWWRVQYCKQAQEPEA